MPTASGRHELDVFERSFEEAQAIARAVPETVLIGGWAVWSFNPRLKSRAIDLLVSPKDLWRLARHLRSRGFVETSGAHLQKKGFRSLREDASVDVDVYDTVIGPYRVEELVSRWTQRDLGGVPVRVLRPTELIVLKLRAADDRRGSEKGSKDLADLLALLVAVSGTVEWAHVEGRLPRKLVQGVLRAALSDYRVTSRLYPLSMTEYRRLKRAVERRSLL